jgi:hypothetical protein
MLEERLELKWKTEETKGVQNWNFIGESCIENLLCKAGFCFCFVEMLQVCDS